MANVSGNVLKDVKLRAAKMKEQISDKELFMSKQCINYFNGLAKNLMGNRAKVTLMYDPSSDITGYTDGNNTVINCANPIITHFETQLGRFQSALGILFHECSHCIYHDFKSRKEAREAMSKGNIWPDEPDAESEEEAESLSRMLEAMTDDRLASMLQSIEFDLDNRICDTHDENALMRDHGPLITTGIEHGREFDLYCCMPLEEMLADSSNTPLVIMAALILQYARFYEIPVLNEETLKNEYAVKLHSMENLIYNATEEDDPKEQFRFLNKLMLALWPYIEEQLKVTSGKSGDTGFGEGSGASGTGTGTGSSGGGKISDEAITEICNQIRKAIKNSGEQTKMPENRNNGKRAGKKAKASKSKSSGTASEAASATDSSATELNTILSALSIAKAEESMEKELEKALNAEIRAVDQNEGHSHISINTVRHLSVSGEMIRQYDELYQEIASAEKALVRQVRNVLREYNDDGLVRKAYGPIISASESYRKDGRWFYKQNVPADLPNLAVAILCDESGSMRGDRIKATRKTAVLLEAMCEDLNVPVMVAGHTATSSPSHALELHMYVPFDKASSKDKYRLMDMAARSNNRDGMALKCIADLLLKRQEQVKLLFIISDGQPADSGYSGDSARKDIQEVCKKAEHGGVTLFAAGIGSDRDRLREIYGKRYLDVTDLNALPRTLAKLLKRQMIK